MSLLEMTITGGIMVLVITVLRAVFLNKLPKRTFLILWEIAMLRLILPFSIPSVTSIYSLFSMISNIDKTEEMIMQSPATDIPQVTNILTKNDFPVTDGYLQENISTETAIPIWEIIWIVGMLLTFTFFVAGYIMVYKKYRYATLVKGGYTEKLLSENRLYRNVKIYSSEQTSSPLTYGIFHPKILLPENIKNEQSERLNYILTHEITHIRRFDMVRKIIAVVVLCVHWFNPVVWVLFLLYNRDIELTCDETVVRKIGGNCLSAYALTLIGMKEKQKGFSSLYSHFSRNAIEERIVAIMKTKKTGIISAIAACALTLSVTCGFATTSAENGEGTDTDIMNVDASMLTNAETGETYYSFDNGKTFLKQEDFDIYVPDVEWWTYDEYKDWLEEEKVSLQNCLGERAWTSSDGWFTWTQEKIDETIDVYEGFLEQIKNGVKYSKSVDGSDEILLAQGTAVGQTSEISSGSANDLFTLSDNQLLEKFGSFGMSFDGDKMMYNGEYVRYFCDGYEVENGMAIINCWYNNDGIIDVYSVYEATPNGDGSVDPSGKLVGLRKATKEEFDSAEFGYTFSDEITLTSEIKDECFTQAFDEVIVEGTSFEAKFAQYKQFGIEYRTSVNSYGNVYYNGELVKHFSDVSPNGAFSFDSSDVGINVAVQYDDNGNLCGVKKVS